MAIWDSSSVTVVGTAISPLVQDVPNLGKNAIVKAILNDFPIAETIIATFLNGYTIKPFSFYREGASGRYPLGLPTGGTGGEAVVQVDAAKSVIAGIEGLTIPEITFQEFRYSQPTTQEIGYQVAINEYGLNKITGELTNSGYTPTVGYVVGVYSYIRVYKPETESFDLVVFLSEYDPNDKENTLTILPFEEILTTPLIDDQYPGIIDWITDGTVVTYTIPDGSGGQSEPIVFFHNEQTANGLYPTLIPDNIGDIRSPYFPIVPIRIDKQMVGDPNHTEIFYREEFGDAARKILKFAQIDLDTIQEAIATNPDVNLIDDSYIMFALPIGSNHQKITVKAGAINEPDEPDRVGQYDPAPPITDLIFTEEQSTLKYLYLYIQYLFNDVQTVDKAIFEAAVNQYAPNAIPPNEVPFNVLDIRDSELQQSIYWNFAEIVEIPWRPPATQDFFVFLDDGKVYFLSRNPVASTTNEEYVFRIGSNTLDLDLAQRTYSLSELIVFRFDDVNQKAYLSRLNGFYVQNDVIPNKSVLATIHEAFAPDSDQSPIKDGLYIPISYNILRTMSIKEQAEVSYRCLILLNYAIDVQRVEWYQRPAFINLVRIGLVVFAIFSGNPQLLTADLGFQEVAYIILEQILISEATAQIFAVFFPILVDIIGIDAATVLAVVAIAAGIGKTTGLINLASMLPSAAQLIQVGTALSNAVGKRSAEELIKIEREANNTDKLIQEAQDLIDEVLNRNNLNIDINPYSLIDTNLRVEYPSDYYSRTINPSIGLLSLDVIQSFYSTALRTDLI